MAIRREEACEQAKYDRCRMCSDQCYGGYILMLKEDITENTPIETLMIVNEAIEEFQNFIDEEKAGA